MREITY